MPLGGYKFAGRYCQKDSLTDQQWAKRMQETKVAAFMAANALANAGWEYDMDGSPDGNIHCLDTVGNNYCTCFKNTVAGGYFAIYTLCAVMAPPASEGYVSKAHYRAYYGTGSTNFYIGATGTNFIRVGNARIAYDSDLTNIGYGTTYCFPVGNYAYGTSVGNTSDTTINYTGASTTYFGYAVKGGTVVIFAGTDLAAHLCITIASCNGFSTLFNSNDRYPAVIINTQVVQGAQTTTYETSDRQTSAFSFAGMIVAFDDVGASFMDGELYGLPMAVYDGVVEAYPFQSLYLSYIRNGQTGCYAKGIFDVSMLSWNTQLQGASGVPDILKPVANGNYLAQNCASSANEWAVPGTVSSAIAYGKAIRALNRWRYANHFGIHSQGWPACYAGWDPSNPDITQSSAWTLYSGE